MVYKLFLLRLLYLVNNSYQIYLFNKRNLVKTYQDIIDFLKIKADWDP
jgi:hypothetical protein